MTWSRPDEPLGSYTVLRSTDPSTVMASATGLMNGHRMRLGADSRAFEAHIRSAPLGRLSLLCFRYSVSVEISAAPLETFTAIHLPLTGRLEFADADGVHRVVQPGLGAVFSGTQQIRMRWSDDLQLLVVRLDHSVIESKMNRLTGRAARRPLAFAPVLGADGSGTALPFAIRSAQAGLDHAGPGALPDLVGRELEQLVLSMLLLDHPHDRSDELVARPVAAASQRLRRVIAFIEENHSRPLTVSELAGTANLSERALFDAFRREFGQTPMEYLRCFRLERCHEALLGGSALEGSTVRVIALAHGFRHVGRFSSAYRDRYGEWPSETLRR